MFHAVLLCLAAVLTAILPTTAEPDPVAGGQIIDKYTADGKDYTVYAFGQLVNSPSVPPPPPTDFSSTFKPQQTWSNGLKVLATENTTHSGPSEDCAGCSSGPCSKQFSYSWENSSGGTWWTAWRRTAATGWNGGDVQYCDSIILSPTFSGSVGLDLGPLSASLGFSPGTTTSTGRCYGCTAKEGCGRLWYQAQMNWHQGDYVTTVVGTGAGCDPSVRGTHQFVTKNVHIDWPVMENGFPVISAGCSPCDQ